ncbi:MAG: hypothetical protein AAGB93_01255 [Planctomycetota bacterium]
MKPARARHRIVLLGLGTAALVTVVLLRVLPRTSAAGSAEPLLVSVDEESTDDPGSIEAAELAAPASASSSPASLPAGSREEIVEASTLVARLKVGRGVLPDAAVRVLAGDLVVGTPEVGRTDRRGRARLQVPPEADVTLEITHERMEVPHRKDARTAPSGESKTLVVRLDDLVAPGTAWLRVVSEHSGEPISGAAVEVLGAKQGGERAAIAEFETEEDGRVEVPWSPGGRVRADAPGHSRGSVDMRGEPGDLELGLHAHAWIQGTLSDALRSEADSAQAKIRFGLDSMLLRRNPSRPIRVEDIGDVDRHDAAREAMRVTRGLPWYDAKGRWLIGPIKFPPTARDPKTYAVVVEIDGVRRAIAKGLVVRPGDDLVVDDLFADAVPLDLQLRYDGEFAPPSDLEILLSPEGEGPGGVTLVTSTTAEGRARLDALPEGHWDVYLKPESGSNVAPEHLATFEHRGEPDCIAVMRDHVSLKGVLKGVSSAKGIHATAYGPRGIRQVPCEGSGAFDLSPARRGAALTLTFDSLVLWDESAEVVEVDGNVQIQIGSADTPNFESRRFEIVADGAYLTLDD